MYPTSRFIQAVLEFEGRGLAEPIPLGERASYKAPRDRRAQMVYMRAGQSLDELVYLSLARDGKRIRLVPIGAKSSLHVSLAVVEDIEPESTLDISIAAPEGAKGTVVIDIGIVEVD